MSLTEMKTVLCKTLDPTTGIGSNISIFICFHSMSDNTFKDSVVRQNMNTDVKRTIVASPCGPVKSELSLNNSQAPVSTSYIVQQQLLFTSVVTS